MLFNLGIFRDVTLADIVQWPFLSNVAIFAGFFPVRHRIPRGESLATSDVLAIN